MSVKLYEKLLKTLKGARKERREILAKEAGYEDVDSYKRFLETTIDGYKSLEVSEEKLEEKPTIHIVDILDASGSMQGWGGNSKYDNSKEGILKGLDDLKNIDNINYTYTLVEFVQTSNIKTHFFLEDLPSNITFNGATGGNTPLYSTVFNTLQKLQGEIFKDSKVLVKVYTDGGNNTDYNFEDRTKRLIADLQDKNFTITFVATEADMQRIISDLNLDESNTLTIKNTAKGFKEAFKASSAATMNYSASVSKGEDVSRGFYKTITEK